MLRLIARDSGCLAVVPEVVVQDELRQGSLVSVGAQTPWSNTFMQSPHRIRIVWNCWL